MTRDAESRQQPEPPSPLLAPLPHRSALNAALAAGGEARMADLDLFRLLLRTPDAATAVANLVSSLLRRGTLAPQLRELVIMRTAWRLGSSFEWSQHWPMALSTGLTADVLLAIRDWPDSAAFDDGQAAALALTDEVLIGGVTTSTWDACVRRFGEDQSLELVEVAAVWEFVAILVDSLRVPTPEGLDPWPPDGSPSPHTVRALPRR